MICKHKQQSGLATLAVSAMLGIAMLFATSQLATEATKAADTIKNDLRIERAARLEQSLQNLLDAYLGDRANLADLLASQDLLHNSCVPYAADALPTPEQTIMRMRHDSPFGDRSGHIEYEIKGVMMSPTRCEDMTALRAEIQSWNTTAHLTLRNNLGQPIDVSALGDIVPATGGVIDVIQNGQAGLPINNSLINLLDQLGLGGILGANGPLGRGGIFGGLGLLGGGGISISSTSTNNNTGGQVAIGANNLTNPLNTNATAWIESVRQGNEPIRAQFLTKAMLDCNDSSSADKTCITRSRYLWKNQ